MHCTVATSLGHLSQQWALKEPLTLTGNVGNYKSAAKPDEETRYNMFIYSTLLSQ